MTGGSHYRDFKSFSIWGSRVCLVFETGFVVNLDMTAAL